MKAVKQEPGREKFGTHISFTSFALCQSGLRLLEMDAIEPFNLRPCI